MKGGVLNWHAITEALEGSLKAAATRYTLKNFFNTPQYGTGNLTWLGIDFPHQ
jgi:hypothetical protein